MNFPKQVPIVYTTPILIPGYVLKIQLQVEHNSNLLKHVLETKESLIGIIPKTDCGKVDNVIGTIGLVRSVIQIGPDPGEFFLLVQGLCRFKLGATVAEEPLKINKIAIIPNFTDLIGNGKEKNELTAEFEKVFVDFLTYSELGILSRLSKESLKIFFQKAPLFQTVEFCLKNIILLTPADAYQVLRADSLNHLLKFVIDWLKKETVKVNKYSKFEKTGLVPMPPAFLGLSGQKNVMLKKRLSPELNEIQTAIKNSNMPTQVYDSIMKEFNRLQEMYSGHSDYSIMLSYISFVAHLPWNISTKETLDLEKAKNVLQLNHYGMDKVKRRILQFIAVRILNPERRGPILCLIGPPGVGKTTIAKAISDSLNRIFIRISLGGINSFSDIKGHRKTYIGAMPGRIMQAISRALTNNPTILLDEIDKMYKGSSGDPAAALLEVLDAEQNSSFVDSYVNLPFDLSQVMFIATANNTAGIPLTLRDRMEVIYLEGYTTDEKMEIAENYLIPKILKDHKIHETQITICKNTIKDIIQNYTYEAGVRELQRKLEEICQYIAVKIVESSDQETSNNYVITPEILYDILGNGKHNMKNALVEQCSNRIGCAIGLSWTPVGGKVQVIETSRLCSKDTRDNLVLTGLAGQTLKESVKIALNWIQSFALKNGFDINNSCIHVHLPEGGLKKDGPSAGITIVSALISLFWKVPLRPMIAMTGEISLNGHVLPVGGVKQKVLAAYNSGIRTVIIPEKNSKDTDSLPKTITEDLNIIAVKHLEEVLDVVIPGGLAFLQNKNMVIPQSKI